MRIWLISNPTPHPAKSSQLFSRRPWAVVTGLPFLPQHLCRPPQLFYIDKALLREPPYAVTRGVWKKLIGLIPVTFWWESIWKWAGVSQQVLALSLCIHNSHTQFQNNPVKYMAGLAFTNDETKAQNVRQLGQELRCRPKTEGFRFLCWLFSHCTFIYLLLLLNLFCFFNRVKLLCFFSLYHVTLNYMPFKMLSGL